MKCRPGHLRFLGLIQHAHDAAAAHLLDVAHRLLFDGGQAAANVALGRLRAEQIHPFALDQRLIVVEKLHETVGDWLVDALRRDHILAAGDFGGLAEDQRGAGLRQPLEDAADGRVGGQAGCGVRLAALGAHPEILDAERLAAQLGGVLDELHRLPGCHLDGLQVAVPFDGEARHRLAGLGDLIDHALRPHRLDADDDRRRNVRIAADAGKRAEGQIEVFAELQAAIGMRQRHRALDQRRDAGGCGVRDIVNRQDDHVVAHTPAAVSTAIAP